jgi:calcium-dependent protein kinase
VVNIKKSLVALSQYNSQSILTEAIMTYIVGQLVSQEDMEETIKAFKALDKDNDGCLTKFELTKAYESIYGHNA